MSVYRITVRFNLEDPEKRSAAEYLQGLKHGDCNRFVVSAVLARIKEESAGKVDPSLLESIRQIFWEEMRILPPNNESAAPAIPAEAQDDQSVLDDLELFG